LNQPVIGHHQTLGFGVRIKNGNPQNAEYPADDRFSAADPSCYPNFQRFHLYFLTKKSTFWGSIFTSRQNSGIRVMITGSLLTPCSTHSSMFTTASNELAVTLVK